MTKKLDPKEKARRAAARAKARVKAKPKAKPKAPKVPKGSRVVKTPSGKKRVIRPFKPRLPKVSDVDTLKAWLKKKGWGLYEQPSFFDGMKQTRQQIVSGDVPQTGVASVWWAAKVVLFREKPRDEEGFHEGTENAPDPKKQSFARYNGNDPKTSAFEYAMTTTAWHESPQVFAGTVFSVVENAGNKGGWELDGITLHVAYRASGSKPGKLS